MKKMCTLFAAGLSLSALVCQGSLIAYESFGDAATTQLAGTTADSGLGAWTLVSGAAGSATYTEPGLTYPNLVTSGNKVTVTTGTALYANLTSPFTVADNSVGEIWGSFIMSTGNTSGDAALSLFQAASPTASSNALASIGLINSGDARLIGGRTMDGGGNIGLVTSNVTVNQQNLYIFRITIDTNAGQVESGTFWINPTITAGMTVGDLGTGWSAGLTNTGLAGVASIGLYTTGTNAAVFDEIRLGTTLDSVAVIPEPGTLALVGIALGSLVLFRRRT
ncbi:MAG: PEP-CTERM sorting domain-containing protein [Verrucomicrobia bacterium]|nr:PEP-CTERM sorting domain-containing protein [Verrucomicrobiota bacterium]MCH8527523.1 PEP-CTERM sorting domain-containing protein [Kiritimatiellia bacterium]